MSGTNGKPPVLSIYDGRICRGFVIARGKLGFEACDTDQRSLGIFPNQQGDDQEIPAFLRRPRR